MESINTLVLVGGYSECEILKTTIRETFGDKRVIIPEEAVTAVVKGKTSYYLFSQLKTYNKYFHSRNDDGSFTTVMNVA
jgi:hypothetical protein